MSHHLSGGGFAPLASGKAFGNPQSFILIKGCPDVIKQIAFRGVRTYPFGDTVKLNTSAFEFVPKQERMSQGAGKPVGGVDKQHIYSVLVNQVTDPSESGPVKPCAAHHVLKDHYHGPSLLFSVPLAGGNLGVNAEVVGLLVSGDTDVNDGAANISLHHGLYSFRTDVAGV